MSRTVYYNTKMTGDVLTEYYLREPGEKRPLRISPGGRAQPRGGPGGPPEVGAPESQDPGILTFLEEVRNRLLGDVAPATASRVEFFDDKVQRLEKRAFAAPSLGHLSSVSSTGIIYF